MATIVQLTIPNYIRQVELSKARKPKYYELVNGKPKTKVPLKYQSADYLYRPIKSGKSFKQILCDAKTGVPVVANPKAAGTPKLYTINNQDLYNSNVHTFTRNKIVKEITRSFEPYLLKMEPIPEEYFPITITMEVHDLIHDPLLKNQEWDMDNRGQGWYSKVFQDLLKKAGKIPDDNIRFITGPPAPIFCPINPGQDRKLVFIINRDTRKEILENEFYQSPIKPK